MKDYTYLKAVISSIAFLASVVIGFIALFMPPQGAIDPSVLWFTAQMLLFVSALLGVNLTLDNLGMRGKTKREIETRAKNKTKDEQLLEN